jgi:hypothetical protein
VSDDEILKIACDFFIESHDFNGIPAKRLAEVSGETWEKLRPQIASLILARRVDLTFASIHENPHIKRLSDLPSEEQAARLNSEDVGGICVYPSAQLLVSRADLHSYDDRPYSRRLAIGEPQLRAMFFELSVLEKYFRDPRYLCRFWDSAGSISVRDEHYLSGKMAERDKVLLQTFGIGYDPDRNRVVAVFLRDLSGLSAEHQQIWGAHEMSVPCTMNSDYEGACIWGMWPEHHSAYAAFIQEQIEINKLSALIGKAPLFKKTFEGDERPIEFSVMLRPTLRNFQEFAHVVDKMLSENLNRSFFKGDISLQKREGTSEGETRVWELGTIELLKRWLKARYRNRDGEDRSDEVVEPLRAVRKVRQPIAHALNPDEYDLSLPHRQDELLGEVVLTLQKLRLILMSHPKAKGYSAPAWLDSGKIVFY